MRRSDFDYTLPPELIAQAPLPERSASRLLVVDGVGGDWSDRRIDELPELLSPGDLLVFNDTRVVAARIQGHKSSGGRVEILLERPLPGMRALAQVRAGKRLHAGQEIHTGGGIVRLVAQRDDLWEIELSQPALDFFDRYGSVPLPPYIRRPPELADRERYQSLLARVPGAVAAPTASLHFDAALFDALTRRRISATTITLHVGAGTFQPLRSDDVAGHVMHSEWFEVPAAAVAAVSRARAGGGRVVAVGTTVARALESAAQTSLAAASGDTALFITPGYRFRTIDALLTNFHLPQSTLLMLVAALAGRELTLAAYAHAVRERYRFFSYGDAMLVWPAVAARDMGTTQ